MRYSVFLYSISDPSFKSSRPRRANVGIKKDQIHIELCGHIPFERIKTYEVTHDVLDTALSAGKAVGGALVAGPLGAAVGAAMGGKKVSSYLSISYMGEEGSDELVVMESRQAELIKRQLDKKRNAHATLQASGKTQKSSAANLIKKGLIAYYTSPKKAYNKLKKQDH